MLRHPDFLYAFDVRGLYFCTRKLNQIRVSEEVVCSDTLIFYMPLMCVDFTFVLISSLKLAQK